MIAYILPGGLLLLRAEGEKMILGFIATNKQTNKKNSGPPSCLGGNDLEM